MHHVNVGLFFAMNQPIIYQMAQTKPSRQIIIVDINSDDDEDIDPHKDASSLTLPTNHHSEKQINLIHVKSNRNLAPQQINAQTENSSSANQDSKREKNEMMVYNDSSDEDDGYGVKKQVQSASNKETKPVETIEEEDLYEFRSQFRGRDSKIQSSEIQFYSRRRPQRAVQRKRKKIMIEYSEGQEEQEEQEVQEEQQSEQFQSEQSESQEQFQQQKRQVKVQRELKEKERYEQSLRSRVKPVEITLNRSQVDRLIMQPLPKGYTIPFILQIDTGFLGLSHKYHLSLKSDPMLVLSAKKEIVSLSPTYIISKSKDNHSRRSSSYVGKVEGSFSGSQWDLSVPKVPKSEDHDVKLCAKYGSSILGFKSIRSMQAHKVDPEYNKRTKYSIKEKLENEKPVGLLQMKTLTPRLVNGKYKVDFHGKAKIPSGKNFILANGQGENERQCLLFAKQRQDTFLMEARYPLTVLQAFALCLTSLDGKLLVN